MHSQEETRAANSMSSTPSRCGAPRVLLVDVAVDEREMYAEYFRTRGFCTLQATNAEDGFRLATEMRPAIVITEVTLAGPEDGLALTRRLRREKETQFAVVVVLSASAFEHSQNAIAAGCDRFVTKPCA